MADTVVLDVDGTERELAYADIAKARRLLGYEPSVVPSEGLKESVRWFGAGQ